MDSTFKPGPDSNDGFCAIGSFQIVFEHFEDSHFLISPKFAKEVGYKNFRLRLKPDAVPTLFETPGRKEIGHKPKDRHSAMTISKKKIKHEVSNSFNCFS